ncbi:hypothetical protein EJB05_54063, partial [Eragrostis curvula]
MDAEAAALAFRPPTKRSQCWAAVVVLVAFVMTVPPMVFLLGGRLSSSSGDGSVLRRQEGSFDKLLGGLLVDGFDEKSCHSRYQSSMYRRNPGRKPSPYLVSKLRRQEALQRRCSPGTAAYSTALEQLRSDNRSVTGSPECKYNGLGNRILAAAAAFLYTLLTDRVLLIDPNNEMDELFCEPFPNTTWLLPPGFPLNYFSFSIDTPESYGNMLKNKVVRTDVASDVPVYAYIHLNYDATQDDKLFFCDEDQRLLQNIPWLVMRTDNYIVPGLLLDRGFQEEFARLFPEPDTVFHHLGWYLFHPSNHVWGLITGYYDAYLATAQQRVGIQVRVFSWLPDSPAPLEQTDFLEQITKCTQKHGGLGGLRPWVIYRPENDSVVPDPPCGQDVSMDRCFHSPPIYDCRLKHVADTGNIVPQANGCASFIRNKLPDRSPAHTVTGAAARRSKVALTHKRNARQAPHPDHNTSRPMRQRETKNGAAPQRKEHQLSAAGRWMDAEAAALAFQPRTKRPRCWAWAATFVLVAFVMTVLPMVFLLGARTSAPAVWISSLLSGSGDISILHRQEGSFDKRLGGLLADGFDERSCHSRYQSAMYRRNPGRTPSAYLVTKLRRQEALQQRCGPGTVAYSMALEQLRSGTGGAMASPECKYLVSISYSGLGNRILAAAAAFLYALLTDRVLLVDPSNEMGELFCEPFPNTTWLLPPGFPLTGYTNFSIHTAESYGNMLKNKVVTTDAGHVPELPVYAYIHLNHDATQDDKFFFCDEDQGLLQNIPWLVMRTDSYIVPGLLLDRGFQEEFAKLFPEPDTVFHHLGRYLFHPTNYVWGLIKRYYDAYLATAQHRVGIQVRVFGGQLNSPALLEQITKCTQKHEVLPERLSGTEPVVPGPSRKSIAVLVTSLKSWYSEKLKSMYWEHAAATGEAVSVHQPSHEEFQQFGSKSHDAKAWAEIYLLSLTDTLVTTAWSTFGYVAQGLGDLRPWVMYRPENNSVVPDPPCGQDVSMDPCFHSPPIHDCRLKNVADTGNIVPQVKHCIDRSWGLKLEVKSSTTVDRAHVALVSSGISSNTSLARKQWLLSQELSLPVLPCNFSPRPELEDMLVSTASVLVQRLQWGDSGLHKSDAVALV